MRLLLVTLAIALSGCTTASRMNVVDLNYYQIDCNKREEQLAFLRGQIPTRNERYMNAMQMTSPTGVVTSMINGTYTEDRATFDGKQASIARDKIRTILWNCPVAPKPPQGCVTVTEQMPSGSSQGTQCYQKNKAAPVNRWEALVD